jgi:hypothetical protein
MDAVVAKPKKEFVMPTDVGAALKSFGYDPTKMSHDEMTAAMNKIQATMNTVQRTSRAMRAVPVLSDGAQIILNHAAFTQALPVYTAYSIAEPATGVDIPGEGSLFATSVGIYRIHLATVVTCLIRPTFFQIGVVNDLTLTWMDATLPAGSGAPMQDVVANMCFMGLTKSMNRAAPPGSYDLNFTYRGPDHFDGTEWATAAV